jgi:hypothetical protein
VLGPPRPNDEGPLSRAGIVKLIAEAHAEMLVISKKTLERHHRCTAASASR